MPRKKKRKIAMVGTAPSVHQAPINDESYEIWAVGAQDENMRRTRFFELHRLDAERDGSEWRDLVRSWVKDCELVMFWPEPLGPRVTEYPLAPIKDRFGTFFMTSSFAWMAALALWEHENGQPIEEIGWWGVDMEYGTEYREQRVGLRHFMALARYAGISTRLVIDSGLAYEPIPYPFWDDDPLQKKLKSKMKLIEQKRGLDQQALDGAIIRTTEIKTTLSVLNGSGETERLRRDLAVIEKKMQDLRDNLQFYRGATSSIDWQLDFLKP